MILPTLRKHCPINFSVRSVNSRAQKTLQVVRLPIPLGLESRALAQQNIIIESRHFTSTFGSITFIPKSLSRVLNRTRSIVAVIRLPKPSESRDPILQRDIKIASSPQVARGISFNALWPRYRHFRKANKVLSLHSSPKSLSTIEKGHFPTLASIGTANIQDVFTPVLRSPRRHSYMKSKLPAGCEDVVVQRDYIVVSSMKSLKECVSFSPLVRNRRRRSRNHIAIFRPFWPATCGNVIVQHDHTIAYSLRSLDDCVVFLPRSVSRQRRTMNRLAPIRLPQSLSGERVVVQRNYFVEASVRSLINVVTFSRSQKKCVKKSFKPVVVIRLCPPLGCERVVAQRDYTIVASLQTLKTPVTFAPRFTRRNQPVIHPEVN